MGYGLASQAIWKYHARTMAPPQNAVNRAPRPPPNKMMLTALAYDLSNILPPQRILDASTDHVYSGRGCWGITAAGAFFKVAPKDLTIGQSATLAALKTAPDHLLDTPERLQPPVSFVVEIMQQWDVITKEQAQTASLPTIPATATCTPPP